VGGVIEARECGGVSDPDFDEVFPDLFDAGYRAAHRLLGSFLHSPMSSRGENRRKW
jgi:hypothetical protein